MNTIYISYFFQFRKERTVPVPLAEPAGWVSSSSFHPLETRWGWAAGTPRSAHPPGNQGSRTSPWNGRPSGDWLRPWEKNRGGVRETTESKHLTKIVQYSIGVEMRHRNIAHIALFPLLLGWKFTFLHHFQGQLLVDLGQLLLEKTRQSTDDNRLWEHRKCYSLYTREKVVIWSSVCEYCLNMKPARLCERVTWFHLLHAYCRYMSTYKLHLKTTVITDSKIFTTTHHNNGLV